MLRLLDVLELVNALRLLSVLRLLDVTELLASPFVATPWFAALIMSAA